MLAATTIISGHPLLSDWLLLIAAVLLLAAAVLTRRPSLVTAAEVGYLGLSLFAVAFLVL
jgi:hypothetical protein